TGADRALGDRVELGELRAPHVLPIKKLEQDLLLDRQAAQGLEQAPLLLTFDHDRRRRQPEIDDRADPKVDLVVLAVAGAIVVKQEVAREREDESPKARVLAVALSVLDAGQERRLGQVGDVTL